MKTYIVAIGSSMSTDINSLKTLSHFRKATTNMIMATAAAQETLKDISDLQYFSMVLGSSYGEVEVTKDFLYTLDQMGVARPFLFQNSLHNATLGFLTQHFGIRGPAITVSKRYFTGEATLETAMIMLQSGRSPLVLAVAVDALVPSLGPAYKEIYPPKMELSEMATSLLLSNEEGLKLLPELKPIALIDEIEYDYTNKEALAETYHDSNGIEKLYQEIRSVKPQFNLKLAKPDGTSSTIKWNSLNP